MQRDKEIISRNEKTIKSSTDPQKNVVLIK